jgi:hypothetical protein
MMLATMRDYITGSTRFLAINASLMVAMWLLVTLQMALVVRELTHPAEREPPISLAERVRKLKELRLIMWCAVSFGAAVELIGSSMCVLGAAGVLSLNGYMVNVPGFIAISAISVALWSLVVGSFLRLIHYMVRELIVRRRLADAPVSDERT